MEAERPGGMGTGDPGTMGVGGPGGSRGPGGKAADFKGAMRRLIAFCKPYYPGIGAAILFSAIGTLANLPAPLLISRMVRHIMDGLRGWIDFGEIAQTAIILFVLYILGFFCIALQGSIMVIVTQRTSRKMRSVISEKISRLPLRYFDINSTGDILSRVTNDVDIIAQMLGRSTGTLVSAFSMFIGSLLIMFYSDYRLALAGVLSTIPGFFFMGVIAAFSQKYFLAAQNVIGELNGHVEETYAGHVIVKACGGESAAVKAFEEVSLKLYRNSWKSQCLSGFMQPLMGFAGNLGYVAVCVMGTVLVIEGRIGFETIMAFLMYIRFFTRPLTQLGEVLPSLQAAAAAAERVFGFLDLKEMTPDVKEMEREERKGESSSAAAGTGEGVLKGIAGNIEFRNVFFSYSPGSLALKKSFSSDYSDYLKSLAINDFSAKISAGQKIAIVGPSGAGKTTLVNLLMRFYEVGEGEILIDGIPVNKMPVEQIRRLFSIVLQDPWIFRGTVMENIRYAATDATFYDILRACQICGIHHYIEALPKGYDTVLSEEVSISAGQKQLLAIARALVRNAPMLILDEATASVDARTEKMVQKALDKLMEGRTSIVIAHRLSTIRNADRIIVMDHGKMAESGTHEELIRKNGLYRELYLSMHHI